MAVNFRIDYVNNDGDISNYYPDFIVKKSDTEVFVVETKGLADLEVPLKIAHLRQWCEDANQSQGKAVFDFVFVDAENFEKYRPASFAQLVEMFKEYKSS